jgi:coproporphyrinogen III oxidase-like Fe-S oxidoreductase
MGGGGYPTELSALERSHIIELLEEAAIIHAYYVYNITYERNRTEVTARCLEGFRQMAVPFV